MKALMLALVACASLAACQKAPEKQEKISLDPQYLAETICHKQNPGTLQGYADCMNHELSTRGVTDTTYDYDKDSKNLFVLKNGEPHMIIGGPSVDSTYTEAEFKVGPISNTASETCAGTATHQKGFVEDCVVQKYNSRTSSDSHAQEATMKF